jgi:hypothetical protein
LACSFAATAFFSAAAAARSYPFSVSALGFFFFFFVEAARRGGGSRAMESIVVAGRDAGAHRCVCSRRASGQLRRMRCIETAGGVVGELDNVKDCLS